MLSYASMVNQKRHYSPLFCSLMIHEMSGGGFTPGRFCQISTSDVILSLETFPIQISIDGVSPVPTGNNATKALVSSNFHPSLCLIVVLAEDEKFHLFPHTTSTTVMGAVECCCQQEQLLTICTLETYCKWNSVFAYS